jgi:hypothetical protein
VPISGARGKCSCQSGPRPTFRRWREQRDWTAPKYASGAQPRRRLCDAAVDAFAARLKPRLSFPLTPARRYAPEQLAEARAVIRQHLAQ